MTGDAAQFEAVGIRPGIRPAHPLRLLAFDPGGMTGWVMLETQVMALVHPGSQNGLGLSRSAITDRRWGQIDCGVGGFGHDQGVGRGHQYNIGGEIQGVAEMVDLWHGVGMLTTPVIFEEFTLEQNNKDSDLLFAVRVTSGFIAYAAGEISEAIIQGAAVERDMRDLGESIFISRRADAKTVATDKRLSSWGLNIPGGTANRHARDAMRHAIFFLRKCRGNSLDARERRWRAWPSVFADPISAEQRAKAAEKKPAKKLGERIEFPI